MALVFRWYLFMGSQWARQGTLRGEPIIRSGVGRRWAHSTHGCGAVSSNQLPARTVRQIALNLLEGAATVTRAGQLRAAGVAMPASAFDFRPRPLDWRAHHERSRSHSTAIPVAVVAMTRDLSRARLALRATGAQSPPVATPSARCRASHWLIEDYFDPDPSAPDKTYCKRGGFIDPVPFDPIQFGLPPNALPATDSAQLLALIAAKQVLDEVMHDGAESTCDRVDVVLGVASTTELVVQMGARLQRPIWRKALLENGLSEDEADVICQDIADHYVPWQESTFPGLLGNVVAGRIANRLDLGGSNFVTDAACASSLAALQVALHRLYLDEADMVLTGGVDALNDVMMYMCFSKTPAFSPTGDCRPFSDAADGTIIGEGVGMLALKRLGDAERDGDPIHAVIRGIGSSSDGRASSVYAPRPTGQAKALRRAYERAGYAPSTVELLEAHGTATKAGDVAEFAGLKSVFSRRQCSTMRARLGEISDRPHQGRGGCCRAHQSCSRASTFNSARHIQGAAPESGAGLGGNAVLRQRADPAVGTAGRSAPACGGQRLRLRRQQLPRDIGGVSRPGTAPRGCGRCPANWWCSARPREADLAEAVRGNRRRGAPRREPCSHRLRISAKNSMQSQRPAQVWSQRTRTRLEAVAERLRNALADGTAAELKDANIAVGLRPAARSERRRSCFPVKAASTSGWAPILHSPFPKRLRCGTA